MNTPGVGSLRSATRWIGGVRRRSRERREAAERRRWEDEIRRGIQAVGHVVIRDGDRVFDNDGYVLFNPPRRIFAAGDATEFRQWLDNNRSYNGLLISFRHPRSPHPSGAVLHACSCPHFRRLRPAADQIAVCGAPDDLSKWFSIYARTQMQYVTGFVPQPCDCMSKPKGRPKAGPKTPGAVVAPRPSGVALYRQTEYWWDKRQFRYRLADLPRPWLRNILRFIERTNPNRVHSPLYAAIESLVGERPENDHWNADEDAWYAEREPDWLDDDEIDSLYHYDEYQLWDRGRSDDAYDWK